MLHPTDLSIEFRFFGSNESYNEMQNNLSKVQNTKDNINDKVFGSQRFELLYSIEEFCDQR
jgi:hypothetical protein